MVLVTKETPSGAWIRWSMPFMQDLQISLSWCRDTFPWSRLRRTTEISQLLHKVIDVPLAQVVQFDVFVVVQRLFPMVQTVWRTMVLPQLQLGRASSTGVVVRETAEFGVSAASCGPKLAPVAGRALCTGTGPGFDPRHKGGEGVAGCRESDSQVTCHPNSLQAAVWHGQTRHTSTTSAPPPPPRRGEDSRAPTVALGEKLVMLRPLRVWALLGAAHHPGDELIRRFFGPCTQVQGWGSCPQGHGPHN